MRTFPRRHRFASSLVFGFLVAAILLPPAQSKTAGRGARSFQSSDHTISLQYSDPMKLCQKGETPGCPEDILNLCNPDDDQFKGVACFAYTGKAYERYNFRSAVLLIGQLPNAKDQEACTNLPGTKGNREEINGISFATSQDSEGAMGTLVDHRYYRSFSGGLCYGANLSIATSDYGAIDPGTVKEFKAADFDVVYGKLKQVLNTLHITAAGK